MPTASWAWRSTSKHGRPRAVLSGSGRVPRLSPFAWLGVADLRDALPFGDLADMAADAFEEMSHEGSTYRERLRTMLQQAGMRASVEKLLGFMLGGAVLTGTLIGAISGNVAFSVVGGIAVGVIPLFVVQFKRQRRLEKLRAQLPDGFDLMARILRAGQTISQGMQTVSMECSAPIAVEFGYSFLHSGREERLTDVAGKVVHEIIA